MKTPSTPSRVDEVARANEVHHCVTLSSGNGAFSFSTARIRIDADADLPRLELDPGRIRLLLRNLLDNALRHGAATGQSPEVRLQRTGDGGITIEVRDYGPGVPESQLSQLAQAFYRPDSARTRAAGGVGLGLYPCRLIAQAHGGTFEVRNANPGLSVLVTLPA